MMGARATEVRALASREKDTVEQPANANMIPVHIMDKLYYVPKFTNFIFFEIFGQGAKKAAEEAGLEMVTLGPPQNDVEAYVNSRRVNTEETTE